MKIGIAAIAAAVLLTVSCGNGGTEKQTSEKSRTEAATEVSAPVPDEFGYIVKAGQEAPDFEMTLTDGRKVRLSDYRGKVVMLQFTASWCGVCRKEMPHIETEIWQRHKTDMDFMLFGIDKDEPLEKVLGFAEKTGVTYPLGLDPGSDIFALYADRKAGVTRNVLIDREGRIVQMTRLYDEKEFASLVENIDRMLQK